MAGAQKLYPRATVKKIVKAHSKRNVSKNVDVLVGAPFDASSENQAYSLCRYSSIMLSSYRRTQYQHRFILEWRSFTGVQSFTSHSLQSPYADCWVQVDEGS
jgi:hypothetical protein